MQIMESGVRKLLTIVCANIRVEVLCNVQTASAICEALRERYYDNYSMVLFVADVEVLRPEKF